MDLIISNQQFRKRTLKGVDGCKGSWLYYEPSRRRRRRPSLGQEQRQKQKQKQRQSLLRRLQDQKRRETSISMGSAGGFINCARLPEPSTDHQQQRFHNSILPCFIPFKAGHQGHETVSCFSPLEQMYGTLDSRKEIPWSHRIIACPSGTCHPYIIALIPSCDMVRITLLNPISGHNITLPGSPISWFDFEEAPGFVLSMSQSSPPCYTVFIIFKSFEPKVLFYRKGDRDWTLLNLPWHLDCFNTFRGDLYALRASEEAKYRRGDVSALRASEEARYLLAVYNTHPTPSTEEFDMDTSQLPSPKIHHFFENHLVESPNGEELLLVLQIISLEDGCDGFIFSTVGFQVFKADLSRKMWIRKGTLGDRVLIIKDQQTLFLSAASVGHGVKGNRIYFSRLSGTGQPPLKMFDLDSETMTDVTIPFPSQAGQVMFVPNIC